VNQVGFYRHCIFMWRQQQLPNPRMRRSIVIWRVQADMPTLSILAAILPISPVSMSSHINNRARVHLCNKMMSVTLCPGTSKVPSRQKSNWIGGKAIPSRLRGSQQVDRIAQLCTKPQTPGTHNCITLPGSPTFRQVMNRVGRSPGVRKTANSRLRSLNFVWLLHV